MSVLCTAKHNTLQSAFMYVSIIQYSKPYQNNTCYFHWNRYFWVVRSVNLLCLLQVNSLLYVFTHSTLSLLYTSNFTESFANDAYKHLIIKLNSSKLFAVICVQQRPRPRRRWSAMRYRMKSNRFYAQTNLNQRKSKFAQIQLSRCWIKWKLRSAFAMLARCLPIECSH